LTVVVAIVGGIYLFSIKALQIKRPDVLMGKYGSISDINIAGSTTAPTTPYLDANGNPIKTPTGTNTSS
jgi:hypothetical protein